MSNIFHIIFIKKKLIKMFNDYNSWIIPIYYKNNRVSKHDFDYVIFNYYCHVCKNHTKKKYKFYENIKNPEFYKCGCCDNENFIHINHYENKSLKINYHFDFNETNDYYEGICQLDIPFLKNEKILNKQIIINKISINKQTFEIKIQKYKYTDKLKDLLTENILKDSIFKDSNLDNILSKYHYFKNNKLQITVNFLKNKNLEDIELCFTTNAFNKKTIKEYIEYIANFQKSKSLLKALYQGFTKDIDKNIYNYKSDFIIVRSFKDINFISNMIKNRDSYKHIFNNNLIAIKDFIDFLIWLQKIYSQKQIVSLFLEKNINSFSDLLRIGIHLQKNQKNNLQKDFYKVTCDIKSIHNELVRLYNLYNKKHFFKQTKITKEIST